VSRLIARRRVIYVPGYDPRGLAYYYRLFRTEAQRFCSLYRVKARVSKIERPTTRHSAFWSIKTTGDGWSVDTTYEFLRWEDIIQRDFARGATWKGFHAFTAAAAMVADGTFAKIVRAHWRFGCFFAYPFVCFLLYLIAAGLIGVTTSLLANPIAGVLPSGLLGIAVAAGAFVLIVRLLEPYTKVLYLFVDGATTYQFVQRQRPDWEERMQLFASYVVEAANKDDADEIVIVGHSSGSFLAVDVLDRALALDPKLGLHGPRIVILTVGANLPIVGFHPSAQWFRDRLRRLGAERTIDWIDCQSRKDIMNFCPFDPIAGHGIDLGSARINPRIVSVRFRDIVSEDRYRWFRWLFLRVHFQYIMANDRPASYDFFMIACGPFDLRQRVDCPSEVTGAINLAFPIDVAA
jgi:hypothetical protein